MDFIKEIFDVKNKKESICARWEKWKEIHLFYSNCRPICIRNDLCKHIN